MNEAPIPRNEGIFARGLWQKIGINATVFTIITLFGFYVGANVDGVSHYITNSYEVGQSVAFLILAYSSILHVFNVRSTESIFRVKLSTNKSLFEMAVLAILITTGIALLPFTQELFGLVPIGLNHWILAIFLSFVPIFVNEMIKFHFSTDDDEEEEAA